MRARVIKLSKGILLSAFAFVVAVSPASAASNTVYDATPNTLPPNVESLGFEATSTSEFGDYVHLAGAGRSLDSVTVTMSNWAKYSTYSNDSRYAAGSANWTHPITINLYSSTLDTNGEPSELLASKEQTISIPWRTESDPSCSGDKWRASDNVCYSGKAFNAVFDLSSMNVNLPTDVIVGVAFNTRDYGKSPLGTSGPYDSLNVGVPNGQVASVGSDDDSNALFWDTTYTGYTAGFKKDTNWSPNGTVAFKITTVMKTVSTKNDCKNDSWKSVVDKNGKTFKNQGQCVSSVANKK